MSDCTPNPSGLKGYDEALAVLLEAARPLTEIETLALHTALGRVLAEPVTSGLDVPGWDNSAMDGYAVRIADLRGPDSRLPVSQRIPAGTAPSPLAAGSAARIFTGAPIPPGADAVAIQEVCDEQDGQVAVRESPRSGGNIRRAGEDIRRGAVILEPGTQLAPQHLGLAASVGVAEVSVFRRLRVALFCSGDELRMPGEPLAPGQIYNSNQFTAAGLLSALGCEVINLGIVEDTFAATCAALAEGAAQADLVLATGGVSVGEEDHVKPAVEHLGRLDLWKIAIRPGKPLAFGRIDDTPFIGTPGNPVSLFVTFLLFARPFILKRQGRADYSLPVIQAVADFEWSRPDKRREFVRARLESDAQGATRVRVYPSRSSGVLSSVAWANGLAVVPENQVVRRGDVVGFLPFAELLQ